jgi:integrase
MPPGSTGRTLRRKDCATASASPPSMPESPLNLVQKWLGHAQLSTTAIYANAVGAEEKDIAKRTWG